MLTPNQREALRQALIIAYLEEQESKYTSSDADGPLLLSVDAHADIAHVYVKPFLANYDVYKEADEVIPSTNASEYIIERFEAQCWETMVEVETELMEEILAHLKKQLAPHTKIVV